MDNGRRSSLVSQLQVPSGRILVALEHFILHIWHQRGCDYGERYLEHKFSIFRNFWTPLVGEGEGEGKGEWEEG